MDVGRRWGCLGRHAQPLKMYVIFIIFLFLLTSLTENMTRRVSSLSTFSTKVSHTRWTRNETQSASFLCPTTCWAQNHCRWCGSCLVSFLVAVSLLHQAHAEHEMTCPLVSFQGRHLSMPHYMPSTKPHPCWCCFVFGMFFLPYYIYHTWNHTLFGVSSLSAPFLAPRMNFEGCLLIFYILNYYYVYLIQYYMKSPWEYCGNPLPVYMGREFGRCGCGSAKNTLWDTCVHHYKYMF